MAKKKKQVTKPEYFHIRATKTAKQKIAAEARVTRKTITQIFEEMVDTRYREVPDPMRQMQIEFKRAAERMECALAEQIERTTKMVSALVMIQRYAEKHETTHRDFSHFVINACKDSLKCQ